MASTSASVPSPVLAETGKYSSNSSADAVTNCCSTSSLEAASTLLTTHNEDFGRRDATNLSPRPTGAVASMTNKITSTSPTDDVAVSLSRSPSNVRGLWMPGVSTNTTCASAVFQMPRTWVRVVCALSDTIETLLPRMRLSSVDLPTLGRPIRVANPDFTPQ